jgi:hypothetical protein
MARSNREALGRDRYLFGAFQNFGEGALQTHHQIIEGTWLTYLPLTLGTLLLAAGFLFGNPDLINLAALLLGLAILIFIAASIISLTRTASTNTTKTALWLSIIALFGALMLGALLAHGYASILLCDAILPGIAVYRKTLGRLG